MLTGWGKKKAEASVFHLSPFCPWGVPALKLSVAYTKEGHELCFERVYLRGFVLSVDRSMSNQAEKGLYWLGIGNFHIAAVNLHSANIVLVTGFHITEDCLLIIVLPLAHFFFFFFNQILRNHT